MNRFLFPLIFLSFQAILFGQDEPVEPIKWSETKLTWDDFQGEPKSRFDSQAASTHSGITYSWSYSAEQDTIALDFEVYSNFYPDQSWVVPEKKTPSLLAHEQLHFDISELYARKLLKALKEYVPMRNIRSDLARIFRKIDLDRNQMQTDYDNETRNGRNKIAQENWSIKIKQALDSLPDTQK